MPWPLPRFLSLSVTAALLPQIASKHNAEVLHCVLKHEKTLMRFAEESVCSGLSSTDDIVNESVLGCNSVGCS